MINKNRPLGLSLFYERVTGIEPVSRAWQARVIAIIRYPLIVSAAGENRTPTILLSLDFKSSASTNSATAAYYNCGDDGS